MKKLLLLFGIIMFLVSGSKTFALTESDYFCPKEPYDLSGGIGGFFSSVTGTNFFTTKIAEKKIAEALEKELGSDFDVKIQTFGGNNLINGKFKKLSAASKSINRYGMHFSDIKAETVCGFNYVKYEDSKLYFVEPMVVKFNGKITENDLKQTILSNEYVNAISNLSVQAAGTIIFKIVNVDVKLENNKMVMSYDMLSPVMYGAIPKKIKFSTNLNVEDGKINMCDVDFGNPMANITMAPVLPMINKLNPLVYQVKTDKNNNAIVNVKNVKIVNNEILVDGVIVLQNNYQQIRKGA